MWCAAPALARCWLDAGYSAITGCIPVQQTIDVDPMLACYPDVGLMMDKEDSAITCCVCLTPALTQCWPDTGDSAITCCVYVTPTLAWCWPDDGYSAITCCVCLTPALAPCWPDNGYSTTTRCLVCVVPALAWCWVLFPECVNHHVIHTVRYGLSLRPQMQTTVDILCFHKHLYNQLLKIKMCLQSLNLLNTDICWDLNFKKLH